MDKWYLYGFAISQSPSADRFKWLDPVKFNLDKYGDNSSKSCALEVDLEYTKELNKLHNDYPVAPDKLEIKKEILSWSSVKNCW